MSDTNNTGCDHQIQEKVLGVADGTITDELEIEAILHHLTICNSCKELYSDYFLLAADELISFDDEIVTIDLQYSNSKFIPVSLTPYITQQQVHVLANETVPVVEIEYPYNNKIIKIKVLYNNGSVNIVIYCAYNGMKIYLMSNSTFHVTTVENNTATFSFVKPGVIMLLFNFEKVIKINITT